jgi:plastocyanin
VSWDVAMTATKPNWKVAVKRGDVLGVAATYDSKRASWYESMGIMPVAFSPRAPGGVDPFSGKLDRRGVLTHGRLRENRNHGGKRGGLKDPRTMPGVARSSGDPLAITDFLYGQGDLLRGGAASRPPEIASGQSLTFVNRDAARTIYHTITACRAPCNRTTGIAYPLADGPVDFDSGELGFGPQGFTAAANRDSWSTPTTLGPGTYSYFCRVHPFMRGAFRVKG